MSQDRTKIEQEAAKCEAAGRAWEFHVKPFFENKEIELFDAFKDASTVDDKAILLIKMQANVLAMIKDHFESMINTGKMARRQLQELENKENNNGD